MSLLSREIVMQVKLRMVVFLCNSREEEPETTEIASLPVRVDIQCTKHFVDKNILNLIST